MGRLLIVTKNMFSERELQKKLQILNYEVLISESIYWAIINNNHVTIESSIDIFDGIIVSDTITENEWEVIKNTYKDCSVEIFRKFSLDMIEKNFSADTSQSNFVGGLSSKNTLEEIRELFSPLRKNLVIENTNQVTFSSLFLQSLPKRERKLLDCLLFSGNEIISREKVCREVWNAGPTKSNLAQLSTLVSKINNKFMVEENTDNILIKTFWGKGYIINSDLDISKRI